ncbi:unnamed protein product [Linum trigynum]|uniref:Uncharacterized protein n=1 Tax=Linum trigynum TaxID=586398 RepID=A0AAV2FVI0_9ROSI
MITPISLSYSFAMKRMLPLLIPNPHNSDNDDLSSIPSSSPLDDLYCEEERWGHEDDNDEVLDSSDTDGVNIAGGGHCLSPILLLEQSWFWEDEELCSLFAKEQSDEERRKRPIKETCPVIRSARRRVVEDFPLAASTTTMEAAVTALPAR